MIEDIFDDEELMTLAGLPARGPTQPMIEDFLDNERGATVRRDRRCARVQAGPHGRVPLEAME